jgi:hypothetical protein
LFGARLARVNDIEQAQALEQFPCFHGRIQFAFGL